MSNVVRVAVTGAAGQVAYTLLPRLASGEVFGKDAKVVLQLLEIPRSVNPKAMDALEGVAMELEDCAFPTLKDIIVTDDENTAFNGCNYALLVGAAPRGPGMERKDLLMKNAQIFQKQGRALAARAAKDVRILIVGNPCNTNCLIAYRNGRDIPAGQWAAMTRLDHNRAVAAPANDWASAGLVSDGQYGVPKGLVFGYPVRSDGKGNLKVVDGLTLDAFGKAKFDNTLKELLEEQDAVKDLLPA